MDREQTELYQVNDDIIFLLRNGKKIGWELIKEQSLYRVLYLSKVLYSFVNNEEPNILNYYHFTTTISGPYSHIIGQSIINLQSHEYISSTDKGIVLTIDEHKLANILEHSNDANKERRQNWFRIILLLLGKYGENKIFSFTINDPLYKETLESNSQKEILFDNGENKTLEVLNSFKIAFEESISDTSGINKEEYLELYFDFVFSQIIK